MSTPLWKLNSPGPSRLTGGWSKKTVRGSPKFARIGCAAVNGLSGQGYAAALPGTRSATTASRNGMVWRRFARGSKSALPDGHRSPQGGVTRRDVR
jgi:hypothetical protein